MTGWLRLCAIAALLLSTTASRVAETTKNILTVTEQTTFGTQQTAVSIGQLADLAVELKGSVSGFKV